MNKHLIVVTIHTDLIYLSHGLYKALVELVVAQDGIRALVDPIAVLMGDDLPYAEALNQLGELVKQITVANADKFNGAVDNIIAEIAER